MKFPSIKKAVAFVMAVLIAVITYFFPVDKESPEYRRAMHEKEVRKENWKKLEAKLGAEQNTIRISGGMTENKEGVLISFFGKQDGKSHLALVKNGWPIEVDGKRIPYHPDVAD